MKKLLACLLGAALLFLLLRPPPPKYSYQLTMCAIFKNEAPWLKEWIAYHHDVLGFEHFYLYNNDSSDNYREVLQPFMDKGVVELIDWSSRDPAHGMGDDPYHWPYQIGAYNDCLKHRALGKAKWVAFFDIDEFLVPVNGIASFHDYVRKQENRRRGNIKFSWRMFGTSSVWDLQPGELMIEKLVLRAPDDHGMNQLFKVMQRPEAVPYTHIHDAPKLHPKWRRKHANPDEFRIHHYWARTEKVCAEKRGLKRPDDQVALDAYNAVEDRAIEQYLPVLREALAKWDEPR